MQHTAKPARIVVAGEHGHTAGGTWRRAKINGSPALPGSQSGGRRSHDPLPIIAVPRISPRAHTMAQGEAAPAGIAEGQIPKNAPRAAPIRPLRRGPKPRSSREYNLEFIPFPPFPLPRSSSKREQEDELLSY